MEQKLTPDPFLILKKKTQNSHCTQEILLKVRHFERVLSTTTAEVTPPPFPHPHLEVEVADQDFPNYSYVINRACQYLMLIK